MSDAALRNRLIRLAHARPDLRADIMPIVTGRVAMEFDSQAALDKYLEAHPKADKSRHKVKETKSPKGDRKPNGKTTYSEKHKVHLRGITDAQLDAFYDSPAGKAVRDYNIEVIAGEDGIVDAKSIERAVKVRDNYLAVERAKKKPKSERTKADDDALDVCQTTPACEGNLGVSRSSMPQFLQMSPKAAIAAVPDKRYNELLDREKAGKGLPDDISKAEKEAYHNRKNAEAAIEAGADPNSDVSVVDDWLSGLKKSGVKVTKPKGGMRVGDLKATQTEISADAVLRNADNYLRGGDLSGGVIYVSSDNHILDGHHRWAGLLTADPDAKIPVVKIGIPMSELLERSFDHPGVFRQDFRFEVVPKDAPLDLARLPGSTWQQKGGKWYGKNSDGKAGGPFESQDAAKAYASGKSGKSASSRLPVYRTGYMKLSRSTNTMSAIDNVPLHLLLNFADSYSRLGWAVIEQLNDLVRKGVNASLNINAVRMIRDDLHPLPERIRELCDQYLEEHGHGESARFASSDTVLRGRLIRLAHARPDLRPHILPLVASDRVASRPIHQIAREIRSDWKQVYFGAKPYLEAMMSMDTIDDSYGMDDGHMIVRYFLSNARMWKGDVAKRVKAELNQMLKGSKVACGWDGEESDAMGCGEGTVMARFEEGKPADPTENMSPEDAAEWQRQNDKYKDKFKAARARR